MTQSEFLSQFKRMPPAEQKAIYKALQQMMEKPSRKHVSKPAMLKPAKFPPAPNSTFLRALGALREAGKPAPTDDEVEQMIADYLMEKYA